MYDVLGGLSVIEASSFVASPTCRAVSGADWGRR